MQLVDWRRIKHMTQADVAKALGVIVVTVSRWECGTRIPEPEMQRRIVGFTDGDVTPNDWMRI
jgi:transcriptional regulator with XRE-family HTH domain